MRVIVLALILGLGRGQEDTLVYRIQEGLPAGSYVGDVPRDAGLAAQYTQDILSQLSYSLLDSSGSVVSALPYLAISQDGILTIPAEIDRESFCPGSNTCVIDVEVAVSPSNYFQIISLQLDILDVNDNTPQFPQNIAYVEIPESAIPGAGFALPLAQDPDAMNNAIRKYELRMPSDLPFDLRVTPNAQDALSLELVVQGPLDREQVAEYELEVLVSDGGTPAKSSSMSINVTITDVNDNHPVFDSDRYTVQVLENSQVPRTVVTVHASDLDYGLNAKITYQLAGPSMEAHGHLFQVDEDTGVLTLLQSLDREDEDEYTLTLTARDRGVGSRLATTTVMVTVADVNDNPPTVNVNTLAADGKPEVSEGDPVGTFVALISVSDPDLRENGQITCLLSSNKFEIQALPKRKYKIITASTLDREQQDVYNVTLSCHDNGNPILVTENLVTIRVTDENDHAPVFTRPTTRTNVKENSGIGLSVAQVTATDLDSGLNAKITYSLIGHMSELFSIDEDTGVISTAAELDYESYAMVRLHVMARDNGQEPRSANAVVEVTVLDENDERPIFTQDGYTFVVVENQPGNNEIGQVESFDADSSPFNLISYALSNGANKSLTTDIFAIDADSGVISTRVALDREAESVYYLEVLAGNPGYPGLTSTASLTVFVADDNDNAPVIDFPNQENKTVFVSSFAPEGDIVTQIRAHDVDTGNNAAISYSMRTMDSQYSDYFLLDSTSGLLYVNRDLSGLDYVAINSRVKVTDHGSRQLTSESKLVIVVDQTLKVIQDLPQDFPDVPGSNESGSEDDNMLVIIVVVAVSGVLICVLLGAIVFVLLRSRRRPQESPMAEKNNAPGTALQMVGSVENGNKYLTQEVEWMKGDPDEASTLDSKVYYKNTLKQNNTKAGRSSPVVEEWEKNVLKSAAKTNCPPTVFELPPALPSRSASISYCPDGAGSSGHRRRSSDRYLGDRCKHQPAAYCEDGVDLDTSSASSGDMSNADSGRGASEEGDAPTLPIQDYKKGAITKHTQPQTYPRLSSFQSPSKHNTNMPSPRSVPHSTATTPRSAPSSAEVTPTGDMPHDSMLNTLPPNKLTVRNVKARDKTKKYGDNVPTQGGSYSILNNMLSKMEQPPPSSQACSGANDITNSYPFNDSNSLFKYKSQNGGRGRRSSGTPSELTDMTSTTSGSYRIQTDLDDTTESVRNIREVDV